MNFKNLKLVAFLTVLTLRAFGAGDDLESSTTTHTTVLTNQTTRFNELPQETIAEIVQFLPLKDFGNFLTLNKDMYAGAVRSFKNYNFVELTPARSNGGINFILKLIDENTNPFLNLTVLNYELPHLENLINKVGHYIKTLYINNLNNYKVPGRSFYNYDHKERVGFHYRHYTYRVKIPSALLSMLLRYKESAMSDLKELTYLNISNNEIQSDGTKYISYLPELTTLNISNNNIGSKGAKYISTLSGLTTLDISGNNIGVEGAKYISTLTKLTTLNISNNNIDDIN